MAMTLRLNEAQTEALRNAAAEDGLSMQEAAIRAVQAYTSRRPDRLRNAIQRVRTEDAELLARLAQ
jgi:hypothetical protein